MENRVLRVVHYLNQFFGGEDKAHVPCQIIEGPVGPGRAIQNALAERGQVVATVVCGDNYFSEGVAKASEEVINLVRPFQPDVVIAGPAFNAGRYGVACGAICKAVQDNLNIPAVTGMHRENAGVELYRGDVYIVETPDSVRGMNEAIARMVSIAHRLATGQKIGKPSVEGYYSRGVIAHEMADGTGAERVVAMLLSKLRGEPFETEVELTQYHRVKPAPKVDDMATATIALVTDGGLVPKGNPDKIESRMATRFGIYGLKGVKRLEPGGYEVTHVGYDPVLVVEDPNRLVPVDVMRDLEEEGVIGKLLEKFYSTCGAVNVLVDMEKIGCAMARELKIEGVSGVVLTST